MNQILFMKILIVNGANLNLLGSREPEIYGKKTMEKTIEELKTEFGNDQIDYFQSNIEGEIINRLQINDYDALIINPGAYTHYSYAIADAMKSIPKPVIEVHISNLYQREEFRQKSVTAASTNGVIVGFGTMGYRLAVLGLKQLSDNK